MRIAMSVCVYYSLDQIFPKHGGGCWEKWELQCLCVYIIPLITYFPNMGGGGGLLREMRVAMSVCVCYSLDQIFPKHGGGGGGWVGWVVGRYSRKWEFRCLYMYFIPLVVYFPKHGGGFSQKWELQCLYMYIIPLITYFSIMEGDAEGNEYCNVCICILFPWSPISPTWRVWQREMRIAMSVCVYYSLDHIFPQHGGGCSHKWELQCLYVYIIPLITYFPNMEGVAHRNENCNVCMCILFPWSHISPTWRGLLT